jgi:hypothetical protein
VPVPVTEQLPAISVTEKAIGTELLAEMLPAYLTFCELLAK